MGILTLLNTVREKHVQLGRLRLLRERMCPVKGKEAEKSWGI